MDKLFGSKPNVKEQIRISDRNLRRSEWDLAREDRVLERQEKQIELEIRKAARLGQDDMCKMYAKQLVQIRKQRQRTKQATVQVAGVRCQSKAMGANVALANSVAGATKAISGVNQLMDNQQLAKTLGDFKMLSEKMAMTEEMMNDALDDILNESGDEEESQGVLDKVLDEIGIDIKGKLGKVPPVQREKPGASENSIDDLEKQFEHLKAL
ncbi:charged multivesicular body protein 2b-like [Tropilaelaps mercedesae]|uniref:Charged multivesicular body protein 2b-like n=1 Tax=Tropilaelaps mercedesae TaxID=418985 RepID=A0A1V9XH78_9ACAR|nr:charged multivesicular body protein 2b-like [Tropilaelaps mercedesae]